MKTRGPAAMIALVPALFPCAALPARTPGPRPVIEHISMRLLYIYSGTLSGDIAPPASFDGWNTVIGEGDAKEAADDMLVTVRLKGVPEAGGFPPVTIEARNGKGKLVGSRKADPYLTDLNGRAHVALWLHTIGCAGKLTVTVRMGQAVKAASVNLDCGE
ncbi:MAG: hypothetical protein QM690_12025 [Sphingobium sp.]